MDYEIAPMILYSQDRTRMLSFLSDVFEFEVNEQDFSVFHRGLSFQVENAFCELIKNADNRVVFSFILNNQSQFDEIINKFNFFLYRRGSGQLIEQIEVGEDDKSKFIIINDIDSRTWKFELKKAIM